MTKCRCKLDIVVLNLHPACPIHNKPDPLEKDYPEHAKLKKVAEQRQAIQGFLGWLMIGQKLFEVEQTESEHPRRAICEFYYSAGFSEWARVSDPMVLVNEYFGLDGAKLKAERERMEG